MSARLRRRRAALDHLARAVAHADERRLGDDLGPLDAWRVRRAHRWSEARVPTGGVDPVGDKVHRLRVTWLRAAGEIREGDPAIHDPGAAERRYHAAVAALGPPPEPHRWPLKKKLVALGALVVAAAAIVVVVRVVNAPAPPVGDGALLPPEDEQAFASALTQWVIGLDRLTRIRFDGALDRVVQEAQDTLDARRLRVLTPERLAFFGEAAAAAWGEVFAAAETTARGRRWKDDAAELAEAVRALNRALADAGRAYFVESYAAQYHDGRPETALFLFRVAARRTWLVDGDDPIEALHLRRIDSLNIIQHLLGYTSERMDVAALLLDQLEREIVTRVGPALAQDHDMPLHVEDAAAPWVARVRSVAGARIRQAFADELPDDGPGLAALGGLLARRLALVERMNAELSARGLRFTIDELVVPDAQLEEIERYLGSATRNELAAIQAELTTAEHAARFARLLARHARPVEQHEVQHRIDYGLGPRFGAPDALLALLDITPGSELARHDDVIRTAHELSAYTTEIARDVRWSAINLTLLTEHLLEGGGGAELHAAILVLDGLSDELGLAGPRLAASRPVDSARAAAMWLALMEVPGDNLARAAAALWTRWYGRALPTLRPEVQAP
ncbi:MAG: hypothetical protein IT385_20090 [Deltaproteobacteria bacterium]|nr:hypothetical protein [Deltaproteobacteria bacterium]